MKKLFFISEAEVTMDTSEEMEGHKPGKIYTLDPAFPSSFLSFLCHVCWVFVCHVRGGKI